MNFNEEYYLAKWWENFTKGNTEESSGVKKQESLKIEIKTSFDHVMKKDKITVSLGEYKSINIELIWNNRAIIGLCFWERKCNVSFSIIISKNQPYGISWVTDENTVRETIFIENVEIQYKTKSWYGEYIKTSDNKLKKFIKKVLLKYKKTNLIKNLNK